MYVVLLVLTSASVIILVEILKKKFALQTSITRRIIHIVTAVVAGIAPIFVTKEQLVIVCIFFAFALFMGRKSTYFSAIHSVDRSTYGEVFLPLGVGLSAILFLPQEFKNFQFGIFIMAISDALAGLVGEKFAKHNIHFFSNKKSIEGSITFFISSLVITFLFFPTFGIHLFLVPLVLTFVEFILIYGLDNLILPILATLLAGLL